MGPPAAAGGIARRARQCGLALVTVLWAIALLTVVAGAFSTAMRTEAHLARNRLERAQAYYAAESGIDAAAFALQGGTDPTNPWPTDGSVRELRTAQGIVRITVREETGRIDLNAAPPELLDGLLATEGIEESARAALVDAILDWRDPDSLRRLHGAEDQDYELAGLPYRAKDAPFDNVEELLLVAGMTPALYRKLAPALTVYSGRPGINPAAAPPEVLRAVPGVDSAEVERFVDARAVSERDGGPAPRLTSLRQELFSHEPVDTYTVSAQARVSGGASATVMATLRLGANRGGAGYTVLNWRESEALDLFDEDTTAEAQTAP